MSARDHTTGDKSKQGFVTHRCDARPEGYSLRKYDKSTFVVDGGSWVLGEHRFDYGWDYEWLGVVCGVSFCPWCGERLP